MSFVDRQRRALQSMQGLAPSKEPSALQSTSLAGGLRGVALRQSTPVGIAGVPIILGQSPGPGTGCSVYLKPMGDAAYNNAQVDFVVTQFGHTAIFSSQLVNPAIVAAGGDVELTAYGCAADFWQVQITLVGPGLPAAGLQSNIVAFGVENQNLSGAGSGGGGVVPVPLVFSALVTGPSTSGAALFTIPVGTDTYLVTATMKVVTPGGGAEVAGDSYVVTVPSTWENRAGAVTATPPILAAPDVNYDAIMSTAIVGPSGTSGTQARIPFTTPSGLDAGTTVRVTLSLLPLSVGA